MEDRDYVAAEHAVDDVPHSAGPHLSHGLAGEELPEGEDRLLTVPNAVTFLRLLCLPLFLWLLFGREQRFAAALLLLGLGATDWVDGYLARRLGQVSTFGKMFDPTVDRLLMVVGVVSIAVVDAPRAVPVWFAALVLFREVVMSAFIVGITALGAKRMDVTWVGKAGTFLMMGVWPAFLAASDQSLPAWLRTFLLVCAWGAAIPGLVLGYMAFFGYFPAGLAALREGRAMRAAAD
ncbi:MAG: CDP-alcohol phosphatidyltransferase family protein [Actinomycetes bacterium]